MNFGQNNFQHQAHFNFHRKQSIFFHKKDGNDVKIDEDTENVEEEELTCLIQQ